MHLLHLQDKDMLRYRLRTYAPVTEAVICGPSCAVRAKVGNHRSVRLVHVPIHHAINARQFQRARTRTARIAPCSAPCSDEGRLCLLTAIRAHDGCHRYISLRSSSRGAAQLLKAALTMMLTPVAAACGGSSSTTNLSLVDGLLRLVRSRQLAPPVVAKIKACRAGWHCCRLYSRRWPRLGCVELRTAVLEVGASAESTEALCGTFHTTASASHRRHF